MRQGPTGLEVQQPPTAAGELTHEFYRLPENIILSPRSDEFTGDLAAFLAKWQVRVGASAAIIDGPVDALSVPAAGHVRITPNYRGSWAAIRPPNGGSCTVRQRVAALTTFQVRTRLSSFTRVANSFLGPPVAKTDGHIAFTPEVAGEPSFAGNYIRMGVFADGVSGVPFAQGFQFDSGAFYVTNYPEAASGLQRTIAGSGEFVIVLGIGGTHGWLYGFYSADGNFVQFPSGAVWPVALGQPMWIVYTLSNTNSASGISGDGLAVHYIDYFREAVTPPASNLNIWTP